MLSLQGLSPLLHLTNFQQILECFFLEGFSPVVLYLPLYGAQYGCIYLSYIICMFIVNLGDEIDSS